mmetsp:Transcript_1020/g.1439  ORF Transcript_1020/g.1439 Transcript_1020/m.1439 type:complete len:285 (+) Transcript_1020:389-1243(+)
MWHFIKWLHANTLCNRHACGDDGALFGKAGPPDGLPRLLVHLCQNHRTRALLGGGVGVHDAGVPGGVDVAALGQLHQRQLAREAPSRPARNLALRTQHKPLQDVVHSDVEAHRHVLPRLGRVDLFVVDFNLVELADGARGHDRDLHPPGGQPRLHLPQHHRTPVVIPVQHGYPQVGGGVAVHGHVEVVQGVHQGGRICVVGPLGHQVVPPRAQLRRHWILDICSGEGRDRDELHVLLRCKPTPTQIWLEFGDACIESFLVPLHSGLVHLVDDYHQIAHAQSLGQ